MSSNKLLLFFGALTGVLLLALVAGMTSMLLGRPVQAQSVGVPGMRQVTVVGHGETRGRPDTAHIQIGVETSASTTGEALEQNNAQVEAVMNRLEALGVAEEDMQTRDFSIYPRYDDNGREVTGYNVTNTISVTIRDLDQAGTLLDEVVEVGANRIYGISFSVETPDELLAQARDEALENARSKAESLAQGSNATLGEVLVITENVGSDSPIPLGFGSDELAESQAAAVPVAAGEQTFHARVQVTFELR